ncbi:MAG: molybdenum ABC transporter ATP-binding protein [Vicinamibacterales bacterium]
MTLTASVRTRLSPQFALDTSLVAPPGITILFGASGSGKSTLLRAIAGLTTPDAGRIAVGDRVLFDTDAGVNLPPQQRQVGYVFQHLALFPHLSARQNLMYGLRGASKNEQHALVDDIARRFHIDTLLDRKPGALSGGERQRVALARALVTDPTLLLLDEPLSALDHATQSRIIDDLRSWNAAHKIPVLYVTHAHREVFALGERVVVLNDGRILASGTPHEVINLPAHETIAQLAGFENVFPAVVVSRRPDRGVMQCALGDSRTDLEVPLGVSDVGASLRIAVRAGDILLATEAPRGLSARNQLPGTLLSLATEGARVIATVLAGERFTVHLTTGAVETLGLHAGMPVWIVLKTHSCHIVSLS